MVRLVGLLALPPMRTPSVRFHQIVSWSSSLFDRLTPAITPMPLSQYRFRVEVRRPAPEPWTPSKRFSPNLRLDQTSLPDTSVSWMAGWPVASCTTWMPTSLPQIRLSRTVVLRAPLAIVTPDALL